MPKRVQRKRTKGWKMPPNTVYVGRPSIFGNPFKVGNGTTPMLALTQYRIWLAGIKINRETRRKRDEVISRFRDLRGKNLACWCPLDQPCHADVLLQIANAPGGQGKDKLSDE